MLKVGGHSIIARSLANLSSAGIRQVVIVTGYRRDQIESQLDRTVETIFQYNPFFNSTNDLVSLWFAQPYLHRREFLYLHGDLLYHPALLQRCIDGPNTTILYDSSTPKNDPEAMKILVKNRRYVRSSKDLSPRMSSGEFVGICKFGILGAHHLFEEAERLLSLGELMVYDTEALNNIAQRTAISAVDVNGLPWIEIDSPNDLKKAGRITLPLIQRSGKPMR
jgi:choline kinase